MNPPQKDPEIKSVVGIEHRFSDRLAILLTDMFGTLRFLGICIAFFALWILWNLHVFPFLKPFDPYPFAGLEMVVSVFAIILSVTVLISQKRQSRLEKLRGQVEFEVNVHAEQEITKVLNMLHDIQKKLGINVADEQLEQMKEELDIHKLHKMMNNDENNIVLDEIKPDE
jgi:uncharacterized membrane protein